MVRVKRTYNLSPIAVHRVRELAQRGTPAASQDAVVEAAIERLYLEIQADQEEAAWAAAARDPAFGAEMTALAHEFRDVETAPS